MIILDYKTLENLADLICGDKMVEKYCEDDYNCVFYRKGSQLPTFFRSAGLDCPNHDGSTRKWWTLDLLEYYNENEMIESIIRRIADPKEYGDMRKTQIVIDELNNLIAVEGLRVELKGVNPTIFTETASIPEDVNIPVINLEKIDFNNIVDDHDLILILNSRWDELNNCINSKSFLSAVILMGSVLEGVLLNIIENNEKQAKLSRKAPKNKGKLKKIDKWTLYDLIRVSHDCGWLDKDIKDFNHNLRDYRNLVHPRKQREEQFYPDGDTCNICLEVVKAALNDIQKNLPKT